jgi:Histone H1-like protein Hc1
MEKYQELLKMIQSWDEDFKKFYEKGNKAAGTRLRGAMQDLKKLAQEIRVEIQGKKGSE